MPFITKESKEIYIFQLHRIRISHEISAITEVKLNLKRHNSKQGSFPLTDFLKDFTECYLKKNKQTNKILVIQQGKKYTVGKNFDFGNLHRILILGSTLIHQKAKYNSTY